MASTSFATSSSGETFRAAASFASSFSATSSSSACLRISYSSWRSRVRRASAFCSSSAARIAAPSTSATTVSPPFAEAGVATAAAGARDAWGREQAARAAREDTKASEDATRRREALIRTG